MTVKMRGWGKRVCQRLDPRFGLPVPLGSEGVGVGLPEGWGPRCVCAPVRGRENPRRLGRWLCSAAGCASECAIRAERTARPGGRQPRLTEPLRCGWLLPDLPAAAAKARPTVGRRKSRGAKNQARAAASRAWNSVQVEQVRPRTGGSQEWA